MKTNKKKTNKKKLNKLIFPQTKKERGIAGSPNGINTVHDRMTRMQRRIPNPIFIFRRW